MSFEDLRKSDLQEAADAFGVEWMKDKPTKNDMIKELQEEGVTWAMYKQAFPDVEPDEDEAPSVAAPSDEDNVPDEATAEKKFTSKPKQVLVKMTRANPSYEVRGYNFTKRHPFLPVLEDDAEFLVNELGGFAIATPREVEDFYS